MPPYNQKKPLKSYNSRQQRQMAKPLPARGRRNIRNRKRKLKAGSAIKGAQGRLKNFRQASILAVAITGFFLLIFSPGDEGLAQEDSISNVIPDTGKSTELAADTTLSGKEATYEALGALQNLWDTFWYYLPKLLIALVILVLAWFISWVIKKTLRKLISGWSRPNAIISLVSIGVWLLAIGVALSVVAGDIRALVGSLGLIGLALSWSLQTPIESFTGWLLNSFQGYYRVGDRIKVGEVFGDVYRIDFLTTTVWEIGTPYQGGYVNAEQPTGRMVTFPNNEVLTGSVTNLTGDFPYVWDEFPVGIANESDIAKALQVVEKVALDLLGSNMEKPARQYAGLLKKAGLQDHVNDKPQVFLSAEDSWTNLIVRYLVGARERRKWKSELIYRLNIELAKPEHKNIIIPVYPRSQIQLINTEGLPVDAAGRQPDPDDQ